MDDKKTIFIIALILLYLWWSKKGVSKIINTVESNFYDGGDCNYILNGGNSPPVVWAEENGLLDANSQYLVGVDPELKGDFKLFYWCCPYTVNQFHVNRKLIIVRWMPNNDPLYSGRGLYEEMVNPAHTPPFLDDGKITQGEIIFNATESSSAYSYSTMTEKVVNAQITDCANNPTRVSNVPHPPFCNGYTCQDMNDFLATCGQPNSNNFGGTQSCYNWVINGIARFMPPCFLNDAMTTTADYGGIPMVSKTMINNGVALVDKRENAFGSNLIPLNSFSITFDWQKDDGSIATYNKAFNIHWEGHNLTACQNESI